MQLYNLFCNGKPQSRSSGTAGSRRIRAIKFIKDPLLALFRYRISFIFKTDSYLVLLLGSLDKVDIDLTMMLEQIADELYGVLQEKMLTCKVEAEEEILIEGDPDKLARVFDNILRNAIAYCLEKSVLLIQAAKEENQVRIC